MSSDDTGPDVGSDAGPESVSAPEPGPEPPVCPPAEPLPREFTRLTPVGSLTIRCARGYGLAVSMALGVLATTVSDDDVVVERRQLSTVEMARVVKQITTNNSNNE